MRLNYYDFPDSMTIRECYCAQTPEDEQKPFPEGYEERDEANKWRHIEGIKVSTAKKLLRQYGGQAYTYHIDRDGTVFETTPITVKGNNSRFQYNRHL